MLGPGGWGGAAGPGALNQGRQRGLERKRRVQKYSGGGGGAGGFLVRVGDEAEGEGCAWVSDVTMGVSANGSLRVVISP